MVRGNMFPPPQCLLLQRIVFTFSRDARDEDVYAIAEECDWGLWIDEKRYHGGLLIHMDTRNQESIAPFRCCEFCKSLYVNNPTCPGCGASQFRLTDHGTPESPGRQFLLTLTMSKYIAPEQFFQVYFDGHHNVRSTFKLWCHLEGLHDAAVS
jgi:hypothetical protein